MSMSETAEQVKVTVEHRSDFDGVGWYVWESEYPDDGVVGFFDHEPTDDELKALCPEYHREAK
jgi:hypothetical protein